MRSPGPQFETSDWLSRLAARSRKGQILGSNPGWERLSASTSGYGDGCYQTSFRVTQGVLAAQGGPF